MMKQQPAIEITALDKSFDLVTRVGDASLKSLFTHAGACAWRAARRLAGHPVAATPSTYHPFSTTSRRPVLKNVNLVIQPGETIGLIGRNGCGKSTLLKLIAGIYEPDVGTVQKRGRIGSLIELGAGFHPEFTGRDNILINGQILGIPKSELLEKEEDIINFSGIREYIDMPVRTYSSGMYVRLAFSIAVNINPDILLADEVLAVGDILFQQRCREKMSAFKARGKTIILVTHSLSVVESWTTRTIYLKDGHIAFDGHPSEAVLRYKADCQDEVDREVAEPISGKPGPMEAPPLGALVPEECSWDLGPLRITGLLQVPSARCSRASWDNAGRLVLELESPAHANLSVEVKLLDRNAAALLGIATTLRPEGTQRFTLALDRLAMLTPGRYNLSIFFDFPESGPRECIRLHLLRPGKLGRSGILDISLECTRPAGQTEGPGR